MAFTDAKRVIDAGKRWSPVAQKAAVGPVGALTLETLTELDPRKCRYRDGAWVEP